MDNDKEFLALECSCGGLHHIIGVTYYRWNENDPDEPEMYIETLHRPDYGFFQRLWIAIKFVCGRHPINYDSTLVGGTEALELADFCNNYASEHDKWRFHRSRA